MAECMGAAVDTSEIHDKSLVSIIHLFVGDERSTPMSLPVKDL
jgi:hypothetical protein